MEERLSSRTSIVAVDEYEQIADGSGVRLACRTDREFEGTDWKYREEASQPDAVDPVLPVEIRFYGPRSFRFELAANPEAGATDSLVELSPDQLRDETPAVDLEVTDSDGTLTLATDELRVLVGLDEWTFGVRDADGDSIVREQRADIDVRGVLRPEPLGFTEEQRNNGPRRIERTGTSLALEPGERILGLGEKFTEFNRRGQEIDSWIVEPLGTETERSYKEVPFHLSTRGYGMLVDTTNRVEYDLGRSSTASASIEVADDTFAFVFFYGPDFDDILQRYTGLTGRSELPPKWSFGVWMSRLGYESREHLSQITERLREKRLPCDVVHLDPFWMRDFHSCDLEWDREQFPDPEGMIDELAENGFHLSLWEHPYVPVGCEAFERGVEEGYFVTDGTGKPYLMDTLCQGDYRGAVVDFSNSDAVEWWQAKHRRLLEMGVDVFKTDYGEGVPEEAVFENGRTGASMHNFYPYLYNQAVYEAAAEVNGRDEALVWGRSAWTGSQQFPMYWGGDAQTTFSGMASALRGGLSMSLSGFPFWSHDIGGFRGKPSRETYIRWLQFGLLSSHARCHGTTPREPWAFGDEAEEVYRTFASLRYRLIPYLYSHAHEAVETGLPIVRPLALSHQHDPRTHDIDTQYMLGEALLVAPVFDEGGEVSVYLPAGDEWVDFWSDERYDGGQTLDQTVPLDEMPLFIRAESVLPLREPTQTVQSGTPDQVTLRVTPVTDGETDASVDFYDEDRDRVNPLSVKYEADTVEISVGLEDRTDLFDVEVRSMETAPETVRVNGETLDRATDTDTPRPGFWSYDVEAETLRANLP